MRAWYNRHMITDSALKDLEAIVATGSNHALAVLARHYIPDLIAELRAARKVVAGYHDVRGEMSMHGPGFENSNAFWRAIEDADKALSAYDAASAEPQKQPA